MAGVKMPPVAKGKPMVVNVAENRDMIPTDIVEGGERKRAVVEVSKAVCQNRGLTLPSGSAWGMC